MKPRHQRFLFITAGVAVLAIAGMFVLNAFQSNLVFFFTPTQVSNGEAPKERAFRVGGMVKEGSLKKDGENVQFVVTDFAHDVPVSYKGLLPDLFKEGKGVVAQGKLLEANQFAASEVLAKHDENYMPPEAKHALDQAEAAKAAKSVKP
ncbi:MAG: cytochrome c maturation protein CcmE [Limnohabitans sp.]|mgnify:FL=1|jgi:cytochrome c-type biogenesis protein CcmE